MAVTSRLLAQCPGLPVLVAAIVADELVPVPMRDLLLGLQQAAPPVCLAECPARTPMDAADGRDFAEAIGMIAPLPHGMPTIAEGLYGALLKLREGHRGT